MKIQDSFAAQLIFDTSTFIALSLLSLLAETKFACAQSNISSGDTTSHTYIHIRHIIVEGNDRTRRQTIIREMSFTEGDSVLADNLMKELEVSRNQVQNTGLFNETNLNIKNWINDTLDVLVSVKERWYIIPVPALDLYDRNFNVWWYEHHHDLKWIQAGLRLYQNNLTGRNDNLKLEALFGFKQTFAISYSIPYFDKPQKHGFNFSASFNQTRNMAYQLVGNKELIYQDVNQYQKKTFETAADINYRPGHHYRYTATLGYRYGFIQDTIAQLNPAYFISADTIQQFMYARLGFVRDYRDILAYPLTGNYFETSLSKLGFGLFDDVNIWQGSVSFGQYVHLGGKWYLSSQNKLEFSFPKEQAYDLQSGLGYGNDYVSGYEYYAIRGQSLGFTKLNLKNQIFKIEIPTPQHNPFLKGGAKIPFVIYGRAYIDAGYVRDKVYYEGNPLNNAFLLGGGIALDLLILYDTTLRFEYSINKLGESGLFFHVNSLF